MGMLSTSRGYGSAAKLCHWLILGLFLFQYVAAAVMLGLPSGGVAGGLSQDAWYNWHKSIGLVALAVAIIRIVVRRAGTLPDWAPVLVPWEQRFIHRAEQFLYGAMIVMPLSGFLYVMAGGYGVRLFGAIDLPNPIGEWAGLALVAKYTHIVSAYVLLATICGHVGLVMRHQLVLRDGLLHRMLPQRSKRRLAK